MNTFAVSFRLLRIRSIAFCCFSNGSFRFSAGLRHFFFDQFEFFAFSFFSDLLLLFWDFAFVFFLLRLASWILPGSVSCSYFFDLLRFCPFRLRCYQLPVMLFFHSCGYIRYCPFRFRNVFWNLIAAFSGCPVYERFFTFGSCSFVWFSAGMCSVFCFPLFFTRKRFYLHIIYIRHTWSWVLEDFPFALGLSSLCLYYSTYFSFFNPECCINQTNPFGANCRSPS